MEDSLGTPFELDFERLPGEDWRGEIQSAVLMVEYKDGLWFNGVNFDDLYPPGSMHRTSLKHLETYAPIPFQLLAQVVNGAGPRISYAAYAGRLIPSIDILRPKLSAYLGNAGLADSMIELLGMILERGVSPNRWHLTVAPAGLGMERYI